jgi:predicted nucleic acid-binding protein
MTDYVVDSNVVAKWLLPEPQSDRARALLNSSYRLRAPDLLLPELASVLWKRVTRGELTTRESEELLRTFLDRHLDVTVRLLPSGLVIKRALQIAVAERRSLYDCIYMALAVQAQCVLITADDRLVRAIQSNVLRPHITSLANLRLEL